MTHSRGQRIPARADDGSAKADPRLARRASREYSRAVFVAPQRATWSDSYQWENLVTGTAALMREVPLKRRVQSTDRTAP